MGGILAQGLVPELVKPEPSLVGQMLMWLQDQQYQLHQGLIAAVKAVQDGGSLSAGLLLIALGFGYGLFHAAGPGHGKMILTTWLLANPKSLKRGLGLAVAGAMCQGLVAIVLVGSIVALLGLLPQQASTAVTWSERGSYVLIMGMGLILLWQAVRAVLAHLSGSKPAHDGHDHAGGHACSDCGHDHVPDMGALDGPSQGWLADGSLVLAMGMRPCSGAILLLVFSHLAGLFWLGALAVMAMACGVAIAVSLLALFAIKARSLASRLAQNSGTGVLVYAAPLLRACFGVLLLLLGASLLVASMTMRHALQV